MRSAVLVIDAADRSLAKALGMAAWPLTAQNMFDLAYSADGGATITHYVNCMSEVTDEVLAQLEQMQADYLPSAHIELFDIEEEPVGARRILSDMGLVPYAVEE